MTRMVAHFDRADGSPQIIQLFHISPYRSNYQSIFFIPQIVSYVFTLRRFYNIVEKA